MKNNPNKTNVENTLKALAQHKDAPKSVFVIALVLYLAASVLIFVVSRSHRFIPIGDTRLSVSVLAGVLSPLTNICMTVLVVLYKKPGFYTAMVMLLVQFPILMLQIIVGHNYTIIPGVFINIFTIFAVVLFRRNNVEIEKYQARIRNQAVTDRLTGLPNRFACTELVDKLVRDNEKFALVSIDINNFKSINDTMGHSTGNKVLTELAHRWENAADIGASGTLDFITRQGGDEFTLIIRSYASDRDIEKTINCYKTMLENKITADECDFYLTASFGYCEFPKDGATADNLFTYADAAVYEVKRASSGSHVMRFTPALLKTERTLEIERKIRAALESDSLYYNLQPQYDISHNLRGFEALARMREPNGDMISPGEFIPVAEKFGLIDKVDSCVFRNAARFFGQLLKKTGLDITLSVNVSVRHLMKNGFIDEVRTIIEKSGVPAQQIEIEITESIMIDSAEKALQCINEIKDMGVKIAIDDFGTGYSSLSYLNKFPADLLKVDKSFIDKMNTSDSSKQYVAAIISIGHIMNFDVISEGVEEPEQLETLRSIGCDFIQGYIWGKPMSPEAAEELAVNEMHRLAGSAD